EISRLALHDALPILKLTRVKISDSGGACQLGNTTCGKLGILTGFEIVVGLARPSTARYALVTACRLLLYSGYRISEGITDDYVISNLHCAPRHNSRSNDPLARSIRRRARNSVLPRYPAGGHRLRTRP